MTPSPSPRYWARALRNFELFEKPLSLFDFWEFVRYGAVWGVINVYRTDFSRKDEEDQKDRDETVREGKLVTPEPSRDNSFAHDLFPEVGLRDNRRDP